MIYKNVKRVAEKQKMSICKLEKEAGLPNGTIGKWRKANPTVANLKAVADVLGTTVDELLRDNND